MADAERKNNPSSGPRKERLRPKHRGRRGEGAARSRRVQLRLLLRAEGVHHMKGKGRGSETGTKTVRKAHVLMKGRESGEHWGWCQYNLTRKKKSRKITQATELKGEKVGVVFAN